jgi:hypothetical protein
MAMTHVTYKGRQIWIAPYPAVGGWNVRAELWEARDGALTKDHLTLPADYSFRSAGAARAFAERMVKRGIERRAAAAGGQPGGAG